MTTNQTIDGVPRKYVMHLTDEAHSVLLGMVEHCLNVRACMGMDEGFKDFDTEEEHDFVKELRALLDAERCTSCDGSGDLIDLTGEWRGYCVCPAGVALKNKPAAQPQGEPVAWFDPSDMARLESGGLASIMVRPHRHPHFQEPLYREPPAPKDSAEVEKWKRAHRLAMEDNAKLTMRLAEQPAPLAVLLAEAREWLGDGKHADGLAREHWTPEYAALIDRIDATLRK